MTSLGILQKISLRSLAAHKLRFLMTMLAVVLGTTFIAGGFILTASLSKAFDDITAGQYEGADIVLNTTPDHPLTLDMAEEIAARHAALGLDDPVGQQYLAYLAGLVLDRRDAQWVRYRINSDLPPSLARLVEAALERPIIVMERAA